MNSSTIKDIIEHVADPRGEPVSKLKHKVKQFMTRSGMPVNEAVGDAIQAVLDDEFRISEEIVHANEHSSGRLHQSS